MPDFVLNDSDNKPRSIQEWAGKSLIINFWATWCPPCLREMPLLKTVQAQRQAQNFQIVGIAVDRRDDVLAYMKDAGMNYPVLIGEQEAVEAAEKFGVKSLGLPFTVFTDNRGRLVTVKLGELSAERTNKILDTVHALNAGRLTLEQAIAAVR